MRFFERKGAQPLAPEKPHQKKGWGLLAENEAFHGRTF